MQKISPYNPVIIETARRFHEARNGQLLREMLRDIETNGDDSPYHFVLGDDEALLEGSKKAKVVCGANQVCYFGFLQYVAIAQTHLLREYEEISNLTLQVQRNFSNEDAPNVRKRILEIGEGLGGSEVSFYNFLIDLFEQIYEVKKDSIKAKLPSDDAVRDYLSSYDIEMTLKHARFGLKRDLADDVLGIIMWAAEGPANNVEVKSLD